MRIILLISLILLYSCGGGGVDTTVTVKPDPVEAPPPKTDLIVPDNFDFGNFQDSTISFAIPNDLIGQIDYKISGNWNDTVQDLYIGKALPGTEKQATLNIPSTVTELTVEYMAYDKATGAYEVRVESIAI